MEDTEPTVVTNVATLRMIEKGKGVLAALTFIYRDQEPSRTDFMAKAVALADVMGYRGDIDGIVTSIVEEEGRHDD